MSNLRPKTIKNVVLLKAFYFVLAWALSFSAGMKAQALKPQRGNASYYSDRLHGRLMSNGEPYHRDSMTCAHLRYPLGTWLRVRNLSNDKEVIVRVTDRGPYSRKFVIDLSRAAARELGIIQYGYRPVEITPFTPARVPYLYQPPAEKPELGLGFSDISLGFLDDEGVLQPYWENALMAPLHKDTTLLHRARQVHGNQQKKKK